MSVTRTVGGQPATTEAPFTITKRQVQKPTANSLAFKCADMQTGAGVEQSAFEALETEDYVFVADATAEDGTPSLGSAKDAGSYKACFRLKDPATCQWAGDDADAAEVWVPWTISAQEIDPNDVTYWGTAYDNAATTVPYTGSPAWVRPWYAPAKDAGGALPAWLGSFTVRDLSYVDRPGVMEARTFEATAIFGEMSNFAPTAQVKSTVEVTAPTKAAPAKASSSPKTGDAVLPAVAGGIAVVALIAAGALVLARRRV